jgi:hypothetical protein
MALTDWQFTFFDLLAAKPKSASLRASIFLCFTIGGVVGNPLLGWIIAHYDYHVIIKPFS